MNILLACKYTIMSTKNPIAYVWKAHETNAEASQYKESFQILVCVIQSPPTALSHSLMAEQWKQLFALMDVLYGDTLRVWLSWHDCLTDEETALCYFCYIGIKHKNQAAFFGISAQSLSKRKQRLKDKLMIPHQISLEDAIKTHN